MPSVLFWRGQAGGTAWYRCNTPGRALERLGWDVAYADESLLVTPDGRVEGDPDVLVISRVMGDQMPALVRTVRRHCRVVFDVDDWFEAVPTYNPASRLPAADVAAMHEAMAAADLVSCSTPELAEGYARLNRTVVLPNFLDPEIWTENERYRTPRATVHVGWLGAFHWRSGDLELLKPWVGRMLDRHPRVRFVALGCPELLSWLGVDGLTTPAGAGTGPLSRNLHPYESLPAMLGNLDVGLVPLVFNRFNQAKSWCKGLEYNAMGVPAVASPSREYRSFVSPGVNGQLVRKQEWLTAVERVLGDLDGYRTRSAAWAERFYIDEHIGRWVDAFASTQCQQRVG